jgi:hypothetical protein
MIFNVSSRGWDRSPQSMFSLLLLGQGFTLVGEFVDAVTAAWKSILATPPFSDVAALEPAKTTLAAYADQHAGDLGLRQTGASLEVDPAKPNNLRDYLTNNKIRVPVTKGSDVEVDCIEVWPEQGRAGRVGSLVAVIVKGSQPGELYQLTSKPGYPVPLVAVVVTGDNWHKLILRGVAQTMAQLADEFELPGPSFHKAPVQLVEPRPNVLVVTDSQRSSLAAGARAQDVVDIPFGWGITSASKVVFQPHVGDGPNVDTSKRAGHGGKLVEGAAGFRFNAMRCDDDCLMRRQPNSAKLPIQAAGVEFCVACESALRSQVNNWRSTDLGRRPRILLDSQRPLCDAVRWKSPMARDFGVHAPFSLVAGTKAKWSAQVDVDPDVGLRLRHVELKDRPNDPFAAATVVFDMIGFRDIKVTFEDEPERDLSFGAALSNTRVKPWFVELRDATSPGFLAGLRLRVTWDIPAHGSIDAVMSVVFKDSAADFDPGGAAIGNKLYPQLALRHNKGVPGAGKLPKVESLSGSIHLVTGNVFKQDMQVHTDLQHMLTGIQQVVLVTDSNASDDDNEYDWDEEDALELGASFTGDQIPQWGVWGATWRRGRLLADVVDSLVFPATPSSIAAGHAGATARRGHMDANLPGLPHWSWLFDYVTRQPLGKKSFVAVYRSGEPTPLSPDGGSDRRVAFKWPVASDQDLTQGSPGPPLSPRDYEMTVHKIGRQGTYDSVHVHPGMGSMNGNEIVPAPFCADLCIHLHVRWGTIALSGQIPGAPGTIDRPLFLGWGRTGRLDQGAHTAPGAPLVPPNQHVEIAVNHLATGSEITYTTTAHDPDFQCYQVFLEQGTGVLFSYDGLDLAQVALLGGGLRAFAPQDVNAHRDHLRALRGRDPAAADREVRNLFHDIYVRIRWYDQPLVRTNVQQVPATGGAPAALEDL